MRFGTGRRLFIALALLVITFAWASWFNLARIRCIREDLLQMKHYEDGVRLSLELSSAVRDQYAQQAHTIVLGDGNMEPYAGAHRHLEEVIERIRGYAQQPDERSWVEDMATASEKLDRVFREKIAPAVLMPDQRNVRADHSRGQPLVYLIRGRSDQLVGRFENRIAELHADVVRKEEGAWRWNAFFVVVVVPLLAMLVGLYVQRSVARPVERLRAGAKRIGQGDLDALIPIDTPDEFGELASQFNAMTRALKEHQAQLVQSEKLAGIGRLAAGVAHEINNPLLVILGYASLLGRKATGDLAADLQIIEDESLRAKTIVDGLLDLSRPTQAEGERVDLRALADESVERLREARRLEGVRVEVTGSGSAAGSGPKLRQVVMNLLQNAAEAAPGGRIDVRVDACREFGSVVVCDTGPGLSPAAMERIFEPFFTSKERGTGLGLAVSKGIVQAHGGTITAMNMAVGGARFEVRLPAPRVEEQS
jgi:signal transduction histidine kinase